MCGEVDLVVITRTECCDGCERMEAGLGDIEADACVTVDELLLYLISHLGPPIPLMKELVVHCRDTEVSVQVCDVDHVTSLRCVMHDGLASLLELDRDVHFTSM